MNGLESRETATAETAVDVALRRWPEILPVFFERQMACPGCPMARFESLAEAAQIYGFHAGRFLDELQRRIERRDPKERGEP